MTSDFPSCGSCPLRAKGGNEWYVCRGAPPTAIAVNGKIESYYPYVQETSPGCAKHPDFVMSEIVQ